MSFERGAFGGGSRRTFASTGDFAFGGADADTVADEIPFRRRAGSSDPFPLSGGKVPFVNSSGTDDPFNLDAGKVPFLDETGTNANITLV